MDKCVNKKNILEIIKKFSPCTDATILNELWFYYSEVEGSLSEHSKWLSENQPRALEILAELSLDDLICDAGIYDILEAWKLVEGEEVPKTKEPFLKFERWNDVISIDYNSTYKDYEEKFLSMLENEINSLRDRIYALEIAQD